MKISEAVVIHEPKTRTGSHIVRAKQWTLPIAATLRMIFLMPKWIHIPVYCFLLFLAFTCTPLITSLPMLSRALVHGIITTINQLPLNAMQQANNFHSVLNN